MKILELLKILKLPFLNIMLSRFLPGDYIMVGTFILTWLIPDKMMLIDKNIVNGLSFGLFFQFLFGHATVGLGVAANISAKRYVTIIALTGFGLFYFLFFAAFAYGTKSYFIVLIFLFTFFQNIIGQNSSGGSKKKSDRMLQMIMIPFLSMMILLISSISLMIPVPKLGFTEQISSEFTSIAVRGEPDHPESMMFWGIIYYLLMIQFKRLWNKYVDKKAGKLLSGIE